MRRRIFGAAEMVKARFLLRPLRALLRYGWIAFVIAVWALCAWVVTLAATGTL
jgi:hypothetical protein